MKTITKILILALLLVIILAGCGKISPLEERKSNIQNLNNKMGGVGLNYNYDGPNTNAPRGETKKR